MGQLVGCIEGMAEACRALDLPIVSGNVSLYNESRATGGGSAILPTPAIGAVGLLADWRRSATVGFKRTGDVVMLIGTPRGALGQSLWLREVHGIEGRDAGPPPPVDLAAERRAGDFVRAQVAAGALTAVHDVSDGGLLVALAEMAMASDGATGALIHPAMAPAALFAEDQGLYVATVDDHALLSFLKAAHAADVDVARIGRTIADRLIVELADSDHVVTVAALREAHERFLPALMGGEVELA